MTLKKLKTNRLFYGKWPYKIGTTVPGASLIVLKGVEDTKKYCSSNKQPWDFTGYQSFVYRRAVSKASLLRYVNLLEPYIGQNIKLRAEKDSINIFTDNYKLYLDIQKSLKEFVISVHEPENTNELDALLNTSGIIICDQYPLKKYRYRVYLKSSMPGAARTSLYNWAIRFQDTQIHINEGAQQFLCYPKKSWGDHYLYLQDKKMITMVALAAQGHIRKTEEFVLRSSINN
jgi:hypothetical protein